MRAIQPQTSEEVCNITGSLRRLTRLSLKSGLMFQASLPNERSVQNEVQVVPQLLVIIFVLRYTGDPVPPVEQ